MTRINLVDVEVLADQHLFAEWREIKMVPPALCRSIKARGVDGVLAIIPDRFSLNCGHVTFFYDKMTFLRKRYRLLSEELRARGYEISHTGSFNEFMEGIPAEFKCRKWKPRPCDVEVSAERILLRISQKPDWYKFKGKALKQSFYKRMNHDSL